MNPGFSIIVPVYNSADCLTELNNRIIEALKEYAYELILINDGSRDNSWEKIVAICNTNSNSTGISLRKNSGQDNAIMAGLRMAKGEYIVIMDDDLQHDPADILKLHKQCCLGYDVCYAFFEKKQQTIWKNFGSWLNGKLSEKILAKPSEIYLSPFKIFRGDILKDIVKYTGPYPYVDALILLVTNNITQLTIPHHSRRGGKGNFTLKKSISVFLKHLTGYSIYPLRLAIYLGFTSAMAAFLIGLYFFIDFLRRGEKVEGWISTILLI